MLQVSVPRPLLFLWRVNLFHTTFSNLARTAQKTHHVSITKTHWLMKAITIVSFENHITPCIQSVEKLQFILCSSVQKIGQPTDNKW